MKLRDYQQAAIDGVLDVVKSEQTALVCAPTGVGKTVIFSHLIQDAGRAMVVAHREELIDQARSKIHAVTGSRPAVEMAESKSNESSIWGKSRFVVASVQTLNAGRGIRRRISKFDPFGFDYVIIDEAHHATAKSYRNIIDYFSRNKDCKIVGFTATPDRGDKVGLGNVFESVAYEYQIRDAIDDGWLVPITQRQVRVDDLDFSSIKKVAGDFNQGELSRLMETEAHLHGVVHPTIELAGDRSTLVFATSVAHAERMAEIFARHGKSATCIHGKTPKDMRRQKMEAFRNGNIQFLTNVGIATEGFDAPNVSCVAMGRPTTSRALYAQCVGRGTRPEAGTVDSCYEPEHRRAAIALSGKTDLLVIDFAGNAGKHKLINSMDILAGKELPDEVIKRAKEEASNRSADVIKTLEAMEAAYSEEQKKKLVAKRSGVVAKATYKTKSVDAFSIFSIGDNRAVKKQYPPMTERQWALLTKQGVDVTHMSEEQGRIIHNEVIRRFKGNLCSYKQAKVLKRFGYDVKNMGFQQASSLMNKLAQNNWKRVN